MDDPNIMIWRKLGKRLDKKTPLRGNTGGGFRLKTPLDAMIPVSIVDRRSLPLVI